MMVKIRIKGPQNTDYGWVMLSFCHTLIDSNTNKDDDDDDYDYEPL